MSEKIKGMFGSKTRADEVLAWLKSQGAKENTYNGTAENVIYYVDQEQVKSITDNYACFFDIVELPRWRAELGAEYYYAADSGRVYSTTDIHGDFDDCRYKLGNYFNTKEEAEPYAEKIRELFKERREK